jgi:hypothetical protein
MELFFKKLVASLLALIGCVNLVYLAPYMIRKELRYRDQGVSTTAQVIQKDRYYTRGRHGGWHYTLKYCYQDPAGATIEGQGEVPLSAWEQSEVGQSLAIEYLRDEPSKSRPLGSPQQWFRAIGWTLFWGIKGLRFLVIAGEQYANIRARKVSPVEVVDALAATASSGLTRGLTPASPST